MRKGILRGAAAIAALMVFCASAAQAHRNPFTVLSIDGASTQQGKGVFPFAISGNSVIAGEYIDDNGVDHGFIGTAEGPFTSFDAPGAGTSASEGTTATAINASGVV